MREKISFMKKIVDESFGRLSIAMSLEGKLTKSDITVLRTKFEESFDTIDYRLGRLENDLRKIPDIDNDEDYCQLEDDSLTDITIDRNENIVEFDGVPRVRIPSLEQQNSFQILILLNYNDEMTETDLKRDIHGIMNSTENTISALIRLNLIERTHVRKQKGLLITTRGRKIAELAMEMNDVLNETGL